MTVINSNRAVRGPVTAVHLVAGKGVRLVADTQNNRWVVEADETVILSTPQSSSTAQMTVSEPFSNFEYIKVYAYWNYNSNQRIQAYSEFLGDQTTFSICGFGPANRTSTNYASYFVSLDCTISGTTITVEKALRTQADQANPSVSDSLVVQRIVGVNRIASN